MKKREPTKNVAAPTDGDRAVLRLSGTPTANKTEPIPKPYAVSRVRRMRAAPGSAVTGTI